MASKNYTDFEGGGNWHGRQLQGVDQAANIARFKCQDNREAFENGGQYQPCTTEEYRAIAVIEKRKQRGGMNYDKDDMLA